MATLNTLRTRFGVVLSAIIAFALLAFVFSLKAEMGFMGSEPIAAEINGHDVTVIEYQKEYNNMQRLMGGDSSDEQQVNMVTAQTWQSLFSKYALQPGFETMGLRITEAERQGIIRGVITTQTMFSAFANPQTGIYDVSAVNNFLLTSQGNPEAEQIWSTINEQARVERVTRKYAELVSAGSFVNSLEVKQGVEAANKSFAGRAVSKRYSDVADSLVTVTPAEIKAYYDANKKSYKRAPSRSISYVTFDVKPSAKDLAAAEAKAKSVGEEFAAAEDIRAFIRANRNGSISENYQTESQLVAAEAEALVAGKMYGPESIGDEWKSSRVVSVLTAPDTISIRHIVLSYSDRKLADSLLTVLRKGGDFAETARTYSQYPQSAQSGGEIGALPFSAFTDEFTEKLATAKKGEIVEVETADMIQLIQVYEVGKKTKHYKVASVEMAILPSDETRRTIHNSAGTFAVAAKGDAETFKTAAGESKVPSRTAQLTSATRTIPAIAGSHAIARWAHKAEIGEVSEIFKVDKGYAVAMLTAINESEHRPMSEVEGTIKRELLKDKKYEKIISEMGTISTLDAQATAWKSKVADFEGVAFTSTFINGLGAEPRLFGAISTTAELNKISAPVKGNSAVYIYEVSAITNAEEPQTAEAEKVRAEAAAEASAQQQLFVALESMAKIKDMRGESL